MVPTADELLQTHGPDRAAHVANERAKLATQARHPDAKEWQQRAHETATRQRRWWKYLHGGPLAP